MHELLGLQKQFQQYLLESKNDIKQHVLSSKKVSAKSRLTIYLNAYRSRLLEALATHYPALQRCMGEAAFEELTNNYLKQYPSTYRSIRWFGGQLADFIKKQTQYIHFPYLAELAQFEWVLTLVFDAAESAILRVADMQDIAPEKWAQMKFHFHPSVHLLTLSWNVPAIWRAVLENQTSLEPIQHAPVMWVVWRNERINQFCSLTEDEAWAMEAMGQGLPFGKLCEGLCQWTGRQHAPMRAASLLKSWILAGLIALGYF